MGIVGVGVGPGVGPADGTDVPVGVQVRRIDGKPVSVGTGVPVGEKEGGWLADGAGEMVGGQST